MRVINTLLPVKVFSSKYHLFKDYSNTENVATKRYYCNNCNVLLKVRSGDDDKRILLCPECSKVFDEKTLLQTNQFFVTLSLTKQIEEFVNSSLFDLALNGRHDEYSDVRSSAYCSMLEERNMIDKNDITLQFNCDGVNPFNSSTYSFWPILVCVNELRYVIRRRSVMLCAIWFNKQKPDMDLFLKTFVEDLQTLQNVGVIRKVGEQEYRIKAHLVLCTVDSVARPTLQNLNQFNGQFGCPFCLHEGERIGVGNGYSRVYTGASPHTKRTLQQHFRDCRQALTDGMAVNGVKGPSILSHILTFSIVESFSTDYLHNVLLGVVKTFTESWFTSSGGEEQNPWYIGTPKKIKHFDAKLLNIKPPCEITRTPRSITERKNYKASEWKSFLLYYSFPTLKEVSFSDTYLRHWCLLIFSIYIFLKPKPTVREMTTAGISLKKFVEDIDKLYGKDMYKYNVHLLLHIPECVKNFGPLWAHSTFSYEHYNGVLKNMFKNSRGIPQQISKQFLRHKEMEKQCSKIFWDTQCPNEVKQLYSEFLYDFDSYYHIAQNIRKEVCCFGSIKKELISLSLRISLENIVEESIAEMADFYGVCSTNGIVIHALDRCSLTKRVNSFVQLKDNSIIVVKKIVQVYRSSGGVEVFFEAEHYQKVRKHSFLPHNMADMCYIVKNSGMITAVQPDMVCRKCISMVMTNDLHYVIPLVNNLERD